jgi:tRNA pseudouridine55 synthase
MQGLLLVDKTPGISSFGVVGRVRGIIQSHTGQWLKVGHSGTLDPAASGLLILAIGAYTKKLSKLLKLDKTYQAEMMLGKKSSTGDREGIIKAISDKQPSGAQIKQVLKEFTGVISQTPPAYSAIKINGVRAYDLARQNKPVTLPQRQITVYEINLISYKYPKVVIKTRVSSGTYIRSLVEDIGELLKIGAYTSNLRRLSIGEYQVDSAISFNDISYDKINNSLIDS